jgi:hypothetical protein
MPLPSAVSLLRVILLACAVAVVAACSSAAAPRPAYLGERFTPDAPFQQHFAVGPASACHLGQRALLSQGYLVEGGEAENLRGSKSFQPENNQQMRLEITLFCLPDGDGSVVYANAVQTRYELKTSPKTSGVSVAGLGSISLPWSEGKEALIKVAEETVTDPAFYSRFFELLKSLAE